MTSWVGVLQAARRLENLAAWQQTVAIAEFARRRRAQFEAAKRRRAARSGAGTGSAPRRGARDGAGRNWPLRKRPDRHRGQLASRLPLTLAGMRDGLIDLGRACAIAFPHCLRESDPGVAACSDAVLTAAAPGLGLDQLARKAEALEKKLAPEAVRARRELAKQLGQRVEARREDSGNACLAGRELDTADVIASKAYVDALAARLRSSGLFPAARPGGLRALVLTDLTQGRNPPGPPHCAAPPRPPAATPAGGDGPAPEASGDPLAYLAGEGELSGSPGLGPGRR